MITVCFLAFSTFMASGMYTATEKDYNVNNPSTVITIDEPEAITVPTTVASSEDLGIKMPIPPPVLPPVPSPIEGVQIDIPDKEDMYYSDLLITNVEILKDRILVYVKNVGNVNINTIFAIRLSVDPVSEMLKGYTEEKIWGGLRAGQEAAMVFWGSLSGEYYLSATVDPWDAVKEQNENNNEFKNFFSVIYTQPIGDYDNITDVDDIDANPPPVLPPVVPVVLPINNDEIEGLPDLTVTRITKDSDHIYVTIKNIGAANVNAFFCLDVFINPQDVPEYGDFSCMFDGWVFMEIGEEVTFNFSYYFGQRITEVYVIVDSSQDILESDEGNNIVGQSFPLGDDSIDFENVDVIDIINGEPEWVPIPPPPVMPIIEQ